MSVTRRVISALLSEALVSAEADLRRADEWEADKARSLGLSCAFAVEHSKAAMVRAIHPTPRMACCVPNRERTEAHNFVAEEHPLVSLVDLRKIIARW